MLKNKQSVATSSRKIGNILGINVVSTTKEQVLTWVREFISHNKKFYIVTPNPELVLMAQKNLSLKNALNSSDLSIPDGVGLKFATPDLNIIKGRELFLDLISLCAKKEWRVFLLGGKQNEAFLASNRLKERYKGLKVESFAGPLLDKSANPKTKEDERLNSLAIERINSFQTHILFVAMENPKQELWIHRNLSKLQISGAMTVGGTFRYVAGMSKIPPKWMEKCGLEWFWRLLTEPTRLVRIFRATVLFPIKVLFNRS